MYARAAPSHPAHPGLLATCSAAPVGPEVRVARVENSPEHAEHGLQLGAASSAAATRRRLSFALTFTFCPFTPRGRRGAACWASRRFILGVLANQRVDGPIIGDVDSPQQFKLLPWTDPPGSVVVSCGAPGGCVFRDSPSGPRARGDGLRRSSLGRALGQDSSTRWRSGT